MMGSLDLTTNVEGRVFVSEVTDCMQMRILYDDDKFTEFECGIDIITTQKGKHMIISNIGIFGWNFYDLARRFVKYRHPEPFKGIIFCDDSMNIDKDPVYINDDKLMFNSIKID